MNNSKEVKVDFWAEGEDITKSPNLSVSGACVKIHHPRLGDVSVDGELVGYISPGGHIYTDGIYEDQKGCWVFTPK